MEWKHDEAVAWLRAQALTRGVQFPCTGLTSSQGIENFPLFLYLLAIFEFFFRKPELLVWPIALANSAAVLLIFGGVRRLSGRPVAWLSALLYAISPCAVFFSRKLWAQDLMPVWACAMFYCMAVMLIDRKARWASFFFGLLAATSFQLHYSALFLCAAYGTVILILWKSLRLVPIAIGIGLGLMPTLPYFYYQYAHGWDGVRTASQSLGEAARWRLRDLILYFIRQPADENFHALLGPEYRHFLATLPGYQWVRYGLSGLVAVGLVASLRKMLKGGRRRRLRLFPPVLIPVIGLAGLGVARIPLSPSYFIIFYPIPFLLAALPMVAAWRWLFAKLGRRIALAVATVTLLFVAAYQLAFTAAFLARIGREGGTRGDYGPTYAQTREAAQWLMEESSPEFWSFAELPVVACAVSLERGPSPSPDSPASGETLQRLVIHRLLHPKLDAWDERWIKQVSAAYYFLAAPAEELARLEASYPPAALTARQQVESERARMLAERLPARP